MNEILISKKDTASRLSVSTRTVENLMASKKLKYLRIGRRVLFRRDEIERFAKRGVASTGPAE